jgi:hypothetical protein
MFRRNLQPDLHSYIPKMEAAGSFELLTQFYQTAVLFHSSKPDCTIGTQQSKDILYCKDTPRCGYRTRYCDKEQVCSKRSTSLFIFVRYVVRISPGTQTILTVSVIFLIPSRQLSKGKAFPLQALTRPWGPWRLGLQNF